MSIIDARTNGCYRGNQVHRCWHRDRLNGCGLDEFGSSLVTNRYVISSMAKATKKDGTLKKFFAERLRRALKGDDESAKWLAQRDCYLVVA